MATADLNDFTQKFEYDQNRRPTVVTDALGHTTKTEYDRDGNPTVQVDQDGNRTLVAYDERSMVKEQRVPHKLVGDAITYRTTRYGYDEVGNQTRVESPRGVDTAAANDFTKVTDYDVLNRVKEQQEPYDPNDTRAEYRTADKTSYAYDKVGNTKEVSAPPSQGEATRAVTSYTYWDNGWSRSSEDRVTSAPSTTTTRSATRPPQGDRCEQRHPADELDVLPDGKQKTQSDDGKGSGTPRKSFTSATTSTRTSPRSGREQRRQDRFYAMSTRGHRMTKVEEKLASTVKTTPATSTSRTTTSRSASTTRRTRLRVRRRDLVSKVVNGKNEGDTDAKTTNWTYTKRAQVLTEKKATATPSATTTSSTRSAPPGREEVQRHDRRQRAHPGVRRQRPTSKDVAKKQNADKQTANLDSTTTTPTTRGTGSASRPRRGTAPAPRYVHDANSTSSSRSSRRQDDVRLRPQPLKSSVTAVTPLRVRRLRSAVAPLLAGTETEKYTYDGFDRTVEHRRPGRDDGIHLRPAGSQQTRKKDGKTTDLTTSADRGSAGREEGGSSARPTSTGRTGSCCRSQIQGRRSFERVPGLQPAHRRRADQRRAV